MFERNWPFGGQGRPIDVPAPSGPGCIQISDLLARVDDNVGEYTFGGQADMLPPIPGLLINELSWVPVPLSEHQANELFTIDENRELQPDQVTFKSPLWQSGVQSLTQTVAERLGYKGVSMKCLLRKLVVFAEGSHFVQQDNTEKEDGMVATLVVQLPSVHEGDNLIVYRDDDEKHRYNFGKDDGTAAYLPHYAVLVADTEYVMEKVTSGCCLVLLYSLCLPPTMRYFTPSWEKGASEELAVAIASTKPEDKSFALLLEHEYDENSIVGLGCGALEGVDRARFRALAKANDKVSTDKKLMFFLTQVKSDPPLWAVDGEEYRHMLITWYTTAGECFGSTHESMNLNFPNPGQQAFSELWKPQKSKKKERCTVKKESTINTVTAYAIIAWPASESVNKALTEAAAVWALKKQVSVDTAAVSNVMNKVNEKLGEKGHKWYGPMSASLKFCQTLGEVLVDLGDVSVVNAFLVEFYQRQADKKELTSSIAAIVRTFNWNAIKKELFSSLNQGSRSGALIEQRKTERIYTLLTVLRLVDQLDEGAARADLLQLAVTKVSALWYGELIESAESVALLWKCVGECDDSKLHKVVTKTFASLKGGVLGPVMDVFWDLFGDVRSSDVIFSSLATVAAVRIRWLADEISRLGVPFSWRMPYAKFSQCKDIQEFLQGPEVSMTTLGICTFENLQDARNNAAQWLRNNQGEASFALDFGDEDGQVFLTITKTHARFLKRRKKMLECKAEKNALSERYEGILHVVLTQRRGRTRLRRDLRVFVLALVGSFRVEQVFLFAPAVRFANVILS